MASPLLRFFARYAIARAIANGETLNHARMDGMFADIASSLERIVTRLDGITTVSGHLKNQAVETAQALVGSETFTATAAQTAFTTAIVWSAAFTNANVAVFASGIRIRPSLVTVADASGFLRVTIAAQAVSTIVVVDAFESGAGLLTRLASEDNGDGASLIGIEDLDGLFSATTVEGALAQVMTQLMVLIDDLGDLSELCRTTGFTMSAAIAMGDNKITGMAAGEDDTDGVRMDQISAEALLAIIGPAIAAEFLSLTGGTMSGPIDMGSNLLNNLAEGVAPTDGVNKGQLDAIQATVTATLASPPGMQMMFAGPVANIPAGWLHADGSEVSRTTYANLYAAIGDAWGDGDGVNTFNLPDWRGMVTAGAGNGTIDKVTGTTIDAGGTGYATVPTLTFTGGGGIVQATAIAEVSGGAIVNVIIQTRGSGYTDVPTIVITGGGGSGGMISASISLTGRTLAEVAGEESHIQTEAELFKHRHTEKSSGSAGSGADGGGGSVGEYNTNTGYTGSTSPMNVMQPTTFATPCIKT